MRGDEVLPIFCPEVAGRSFLTFGKQSLMMANLREGLTSLGLLMGRRNFVWYMFQQ